MAGIQARFGGDLRVSFTCAEPVLGGQLVERRAGTRVVGVAAAGSLVVAGVAMFDVPAARSFIGGPQVGDGNELTVFVGDAVLLVTYAAAANPGDHLIAAANGQVTPAGAAPDARTIVGQCFDGAAAGATALMVLD